MDKCCSAPEGCPKCRKALSQSEHAPTPWGVDKNGRVIDRDGNLVADIHASPCRCKPSPAELITDNMDIEDADVVRETLDGAGELFAKAKAKP